MCGQHLSGDLVARVVAVRVVGQEVERATVLLPEKGADERTEVCTRCSRGGLQAPFQRLPVVLAGLHAALLDHALHDGVPNSSSIRMGVDQKLRAARGTALTHPLDQGRK